MFGLPKNYPGKHAVMLLFVAVLLFVAFLSDHLLDEIEAVDVLYTVPIIAATIVLSPVEILGTGLVAMIMELTTEADPLTKTAEDIWTALAVGVFGALMALTSMLVRRYVHRIGAARDALESSPLAYAELSFPGYVLKNHNEAFSHLFPDGAESRDSLFASLPEKASSALAGLLDEAVTTRTQINVEEFPFPDSEGQNSYWNLSLIPAPARHRSNPESVSMFALDVTGAVHRSRTRDAALRISSAVMSSLNLEETYHVVLDSLAYIAGTNAGGLFLIEDDQWIGVAGWGDYTDELARRLRWPYDDLPTGVDAVESKQAVAVEDAAKDSRFRTARVKQFNIRSALVVPLVTGNRKIGAVWLVQTDKIKRFTNEQAEFATVIGAQAALAIDNAAAYESELGMRKSLEAIETVSEAGLTSLDLGEVLIELVTRTQDVLKMDAAMIMLLDESGENLEAQAVAGKSGATVPGLKIRVGEGLAGRAFKEGVPMKIDDITGHEGEMCPDGSCRDGSCPFSEKLGIKSVLAVPLRIGGRVAGILQLGSRQEKAFAAREWGLIQVLADRASLAVQNSLLHKKTKQELTRVALLRDVAAACAGQNEIKDIAESALRAIYEQLDCDLASIFYFDPVQEALVSIAFLGHPPEVTEAISTIGMDQDTFLVRAVKERRIVTNETHPSEDASETEAFILRSLDIENKRRAAVPFIYKGKVVGGMALAFQKQRPFTSASLDALSSIANQLAVAIHNSRLAESDGGLLMEQRVDD